MKSFHIKQRSVRACYLHSFSTWELQLWTTRYHTIIPTSPIWAEGKMKPERAQTGEKQHVVRTASAHFQPAQLTGYHLTISVCNQMFSIKNRPALETEKNHFTYLLCYPMLIIKDSFQLETVVSQKAYPTKLWTKTYHWIFFNTKKAGLI